MNTIHINRSNEVDELLKLPDKVLKKDYIRKLVRKFKKLQFKYKKDTTQLKKKISTLEHHNEEMVEALRKRNKRIKALEDTLYYYDPYLKVKSIK